MGGEGRNGETGKEVEKELRGRECGGDGVGGKGSMQVTPRLSLMASGYMCA